MSPRPREHWVGVWVAGHELPGYTHGQMTRREAITALARGAATMRSVNVVARERGAQSIPWEVRLYAGKRANPIKTISAKSAH